MSGFEVRTTGMDDLKRKFKELAQQKLIELSGQYQELLDDLTATQAGRPIGEIQSLLRLRWQQIGGDITDPELTAYAQQMSAGGRIVLQVKDVE